MQPYVDHFLTKFETKEPNVSAYELKKLLLIIYQSAINPSAHVKIFNLKHLTFPLTAHEKQHLYNLTVNKKDFDKLIIGYMIELDEDLFIKEG